MNVLTSARAARWLIAVAVLVALSHLPSQFSTARQSWPVVRLWAEPEAQQRLALGDIPYDMLRAADAALPREASLLLVTSGDDVRRFEYTTFHRALYSLTPRPVWWLSPAPPDGTWEARWWHATPLTPESVCATAAEREVTHLLLVGVQDELGSVELPCVVGQPLLEQAEGVLLPLQSSTARPVTMPQPLLLPTLWPLRLVTALGSMLLLGLTVLRLSHYRGSWIEALALAWTFGSGGVSVGMWWLNGLGLSLAWQVTLLTAGAMVGAMWLGRRWRAYHPGRPRLGEPSVPPVARLRSPVLSVPAVLLGYLALQVAFVAWQAVGRPLTVWDSWVTWGMKARTIFLEGGITPALYADASRIVTHLDYPLLLPLTEAWLFQWLGAPDDRLAGAATLGAYLALLGVCYVAVRRWDGERGFALAVAVAIGGGTSLAGLAGLVFADVPLALKGTIAALFLVEWLRGGRRTDLLVAALAGGLLPWTKREGLLLLGVMVAALLLWGWRHGRANATGRSLRAAGALVVAGLVLAGPWWALVAWQSVPNSGDFAPVSLSLLLANLDRLPTIVALTAQILGSTRWNFLWPLAFLFALFLFVRGARPLREGDLLPAIAILYVALAAASYLFSAYEPYQQHVVSSVSRLIAHVTPLTGLWIAWRALRGVIGDPAARPLDS